MEKLTLSIREAAKVIGISDRYMYDLARTEGFPTIHIGKRVLISRKGLERWMDEQTEKAMAGGV